MRPRTWLAPREGVEPVADGPLGQPVPGGMELDLVDPVAETIVRPQHRRMGVGLEAPVDRLLRARETPQLADHVGGPRRAFPLEGFAKRRVGLEEVVVDERRWLVEVHAERLAATREAETNAWRQTCGFRAAQRDVWRQACAIGLAPGR